MFTTAIGYMSSAYMMKHTNEVNADLGACIILDMFAWFIFGMYLGVV